MVRVRSARPLQGHSVSVIFTDGSNRKIDLHPYLRGPIFEEIRAIPDRFRELRVDPILGTIVWPNGADICPDVLSQGRPTVRG